MGPKEMDHDTPTKDEVQPSTEIHKGEHNSLPSCSDRVLQTRYRSDSSPLGVAGGP